MLRERIPSAAMGLPCVLRYSPVGSRVRRHAKRENAASSNPKIIYQAGVGGFRWTFRNYPTDENRALVVAKYAKPPLGTGWTASVTLQI